MADVREFVSMYAPPHRQAGRPGERWTLSENLRDWLFENGFVYHPSYGWTRSDVDCCDSYGDHAWVYTLLRTADLLDAEVSRLERDMRHVRAPLKIWAVLREGGGLGLDDLPLEDRVAEGRAREETLSLGSSGLDDDVDWNQDRILFNICAYTELHALYIFATDFTQQPSQSQVPADAAMPKEYYDVSIVDLLEHLAYDPEEDRWDILRSTHRLANIDLGRYRLVQSSSMSLNAEETEVVQKPGIACRYEN